MTAAVLGRALERMQVMRKLQEYTLVSADGVFAGAVLPDFLSYRDDAYLRDGLGQLMACDAMLMGRTTYESFSKLWPARTDPWANRMNSMKKYVFSSTLEYVEWENSVIVRGDVATEVAKLKAMDGGDLLIYGHGLLAETLLAAQLLDVLDISIHPVLAGSGKLLFRDGQNVKMKHVSTKTFSQIVKLTYQPQY
jgi:dihydrofolate reductase